VGENQTFWGDGHRENNPIWGGVRGHTYLTSVLCIGRCELASQTVLLESGICDERMVEAEPNTFKTIVPA